MRRGVFCHFGVAREKNTRVRERQGMRLKEAGARSKSLLTLSSWRFAPDTDEGEPLIGFKQGRGRAGQMF